MHKIYLDTSVISALFDERNPDRKMLTENFFAQIQDYEVDVSDLTLDEIKKNRHESLKEKMQACARSFIVLEETEAVIALAHKLVQAKAVPQSSFEDASHIAFAVIAEVTFLVSWNFRHLVRLKTREVVHQVTLSQGYNPIQIVAPPEII